ncbi:Pol [Symbiodinium sp. CCMP2592]|nr:Pol [Symbiodinium sp. CCMP2592]
MEHEAGRTVDIFLVQETAWQEDMEYSTNSQAAHAVNWHVIHSTGKDRTGILCMVRKGLLQPDQIRTSGVLPGRLLHIRLLFHTPLDILCIYQHAWNMQNSSLRGANKKEALLALRRRVWNAVDKWLLQIPQRHGCLIAGDFNLTIHSEDHICGTGSPDQGPPHPDQGILMDILRAHRCCVLNTWGKRGIASRTYLPPGADSRQHGTQIDLMIGRGHMVDTVSKQSAPLDAPFVPGSGCRHRPLQVFLPRPRRPTHVSFGAPLKPYQVKQRLHQPGFAPLLYQATAHNLQEISGLESIDEMLLAGWNSSTHHWSTAQATPAPSPTVDLEGPLTTSVQEMWNLRSRLQQAGGALHEWRRQGPETRHAFRAWALATRLQQHTRALRKACRLRKTAAVAEVVASSNVFQAAKRFGPKAPRRRLQLRRENGSLQTHEEEFDQIKDYFTALYHAPQEIQQPALPEDLHFSELEVSMAMRRIQPTKAMPSCSAPSMLWKFFGPDVVRPLCRQFAQILTKGCTALPEAWNISELILIPKPNKTLSTPAHLRPICLLPLQPKLIAAILAGRLQQYVTRFLHDLPQFAYVQNRTMSQCLERAVAHCATVRNLIQTHAPTLYTKRQGRLDLRLYGGCQLSLDVSCAYDHVPRTALEQSLNAAQVPQALVQAVVLIHEQAQIKISHGGQAAYIRLRRGLRQGCSLSPLLWAVYSGFVLQHLHLPGTLDVPKDSNVYADDKHFAWVIRCGKDMENAYAAIKHVLAGLLRSGLKISFDKTVVLLELRGPQANSVMTRYVVNLEKGQHMKFIIEGKPVFIRIVTQHVYLGSIISYRRFEAQSFKHRLQIAKNAYTRLKPILCNRSVPLHLRLQLWKGCIWPAALHGLDCTGLTHSDHQTLHVELIKQARAIANSQSMLTKESNVKFLQRLRLTDPVTRLRDSIQRRDQHDQLLGPGLQPSEEQLQWRALLRGQVAESESTAWNAQPPMQSSTKLMCVDNVLSETFSCDVCGQEFTTQAALKRHMFKSHFDQQQREDRTEEVRELRNKPSMVHSLDGMPQCRHCKHAFGTWHEFFYHVSSRSCQMLRYIYDQPDPETTILPLLSEALIDSAEILTLTKDCKWQDLAQLPLVGLLIWLEIRDNLGRLSSPHMFENMFEHRGELPVPDELKSATQDLNFLRSLLPAMNLDQLTMDVDPEEFPDQDLDDRPPKWQKPGPKGSQHRGRGKGNQPKGSQAWTSANSWGGKDWANRRPNKNWQQAPWHQTPSAHTSDGELTKRQNKQLAELKAIVSLLTSLVLRQEIQLNLHKQDTSYVVFINTQEQQSLAHTLHGVGVQWHKVKQETPDQLNHPMRVVMFQHFVEVVQTKFLRMIASPSSRSQAAERGLLQESDGYIPALRWDPKLKKHIRDDHIEALSQTEIKEALQRLLVLCTTRQSTHAVPRDEEALRRVRLTHTGDVLGGGHASKRGRGVLAPVTSPEPISHTAGGGLFHEARAPPNECLSEKACSGITVSLMQLGNLQNFCYSNAVLKALLHMACHSGSLSTVFASQHHQFLLAIARRSQAAVVHLWQHPLWLSIVRGWQHPARQHDAAEFLEHICGSSLVLNDNIECVWQARKSNQASYRIDDCGQSAPITLLPPSTDCEGVRCCVSVQDLINQWHIQEQVHAMVIASQFLVLQANRFSFMADTHRTAKRHYRIRADLEIDFPCFVCNTSVECCQVRYRLSSVVTHRGEAPTHGHYQTLLYDAHTDAPAVRLADDGRQATRISAEQLETMGCETYLFFYVRC